MDKTKSYIKLLSVISLAIEAREKIMSLLGRVAK
tara:strand:+ start:18 stop:119 length:102 start_codon:yes stop_codon:yes gene_type:complete